MTLSPPKAPQVARRARVAPTAAYAPADIHSNACFPAEVQSISRAPGPCSKERFTPLSSACASAQFPARRHIPRMRAPRSTERPVCGRTCAIRATLATRVGRTKIIE